MEPKQAIKEEQPPLNKGLLLVDDVQDVKKNRTLVEKVQDMNSKLVMVVCTVLVSMLITLTGYFYNTSASQDRVLMNESKSIALSNKDDINEIKIQLAVISEKLDSMKNGNE